MRHLYLTSSHFYLDEMNCTKYYPATLFNTSNKASNPPTADYYPSSSLISIRLSNSYSSISSISGILSHFTDKLVLCESSRIITPIISKSSQALIWKLNSKISLSGKKKFLFHLQRSFFSPLSAKSNTSHVEQKIKK